MKPFRWILLCGTFLGCSDEPKAAEPAVAAGTIDYSGWARLTADRSPSFVAPYSTLCDPSGVIGPHSTSVARYYANPVAMPALRSGGPLPVKSIILKEKLGENDARPSAYAAMTKREPGFDSAHGDWEYTFVDLVGGKRYENGQLENCRTCHQSCKDRDFLFLTYWEGASGERSNQ